MAPSFEGIRPLAATVDLGRVKHNVRYLEGLTPPGCRFMAVVKANAYGHGDTRVARAALDAGAHGRGVALVEEGARLRQADFDCPIYLLFEPPPRGADAAVELGLVCSVYSEPFARALSEACSSTGRTVSVHLKIDSGMHRVGVPESRAAAFAGLLASLPGLSVDGAYTHFAVATEPDDPFTEKQMDAFERACVEVEAAVGHGVVKHAANSAGVMAFPRSHYDMVRVGIAMLGLFPSDEFAGVAELQPALSLAGEVAFVKRVAAGEGVSYGLTYAPAGDTWIATLPVGYADGLSRLLSGKAQVIIDGRRRDIVGTICMDVCLADLGVEPVEPGTRFTIIGQEGDERIRAEDVAREMGTINYEVACMISSRVPRLFIDEA